MTEREQRSSASLAAAPRGSVGKLPRRSFWLLIVLSALATLAARRLMDDPSLARIVATVGLSLCGMHLLCWFYFRSSYAPKTRKRVVFGVLALAILAAFSIRVESFSGSLVPTWKFAWQEAHDKTLAELPQVDSSTVDLTTTTPDDFPRFLGPDGDQVVHGTLLATTWGPHEPRLLWRREIGAGWSGFATVNGFAVTMEQRGDQELVTCYSVATGEPQWSAAVKARHKTSLGHIGPRCTPLIHEGRVYAMGATGVLRCLEGGTGVQLWQRDFFKEMGLSQQEAERSVSWGRAASPLVADNKLIVTIGGDEPGSSVNVAALDLETGDTIWEGGQQQISYASPVVATLAGVPQVVNVNESSVSGHDLATGELLWEHPWPGSSRATATCSNPTIVDNERVLLTKGYGQGAELLRVVQDDTSEWEVESVWQNRRALKTKFSNVSLINGYAYGLDDGVMCCVDVETGKRMWKKGRYRYGQILATDNVILVLSERGQLAMVEPTPSGYNQLAQVDALDGQTWNTLCLTGHRLLVRNSKEAACFELPQ